MFISFWVKFFFNHPVHQRCWVCWSISSYSGWCIASCGLCSRLHDTGTLGIPHQRLANSSTGHHTACDDQLSFHTVIIITDESVLLRRMNSAHRTIIMPEIVRFDHFHVCGIRTFEHQCEVSQGNACLSWLAKNTSRYYTWSSNMSKHQEMRIWSIRLTVCYNWTRPSIGQCLFSSGVFRWIYQHFVSRTFLKQNRCTYLYRYTMFMNVSFENLTRYSSATKLCL